MLNLRGLLLQSPAYGEDSEDTTNNLKTLVFNSGQMVQRSTV
jgi:hypothetical protein